MRVKSLTPPLPSVLPMTAMTSSALNWPFLIAASMPEASCTFFNSTLATWMAIAFNLRWFQQKKLSSCAAVRRTALLCSPMIRASMRMRRYQSPDEQCTFNRRMDCWVKPGNDARSSARPHPRLDFATQHFVEPRAAVDHRWRGFALLPEIGSQRRGRRRFDIECTVGGGEQHHAIIFARRFGRNLAVDDVALHQFRLAVQRIAPAAAAGGHDAHNLPGAHRLPPDPTPRAVRGRAPP